MRKNFVKLVLMIFSLTLLGGFLFSSPALAAIELVKSADFGTVYYLDSTGVRHPFPNQTTYESWYGKNFSKIVTVSNEFLSQYPLGKNITVRPGTYLVKVRTAPQVYAVEPGGVLREIENESVAEELYGKTWAKRVVDVADVFFGDYTVGKVVDKSSEVPDGVLFQHKLTGTYYYKRSGLLQPFDSVQSVLDNHFRLEDKIVSEQDYLFAQRTRPIAGFDKNVFNPVAKALVDTRDCENKKLKAAVIFLSKENFDAEQLGKLETIKSGISDRYTWVSYELSSMDVSYPTVAMVGDSYILNPRNDGTTEIKDEVINTFYDNNPDVFDFIIIWTNFKIPAENTNEIASFSGITNRLKGIGRDPLNWSKAYGTTGKLKGVIVMGDIDKYQTSTPAGLNESLNLVMHELLHQWAAYVSFIDEDGQSSTALLRDKDYKHWSYYTGFLSPLGGSGWIDNGNGTFTSQLSQMSDTNLRRFSQLDLYLMGLIPYQLMSPVFYVEPQTPGAVGNTISGTAQWVTVDQIMAAHGQVVCNQF